MGLVSQIFHEEELDRLGGGIAGIGHVRYSTTGSSTLCNAQPMYAVGNYSVAIAHNGNLINTAQLREEALSRGLKLEGNADTEALAVLLAYSESQTFEAALIQVLNMAQGAYSLVILTPSALYAARDPFGIRPLSLGKMNGGERWVVASETCAFPVAGAKFVRDVEPGEIVRVDSSGLTSIHQLARHTHKLCGFEFVYIARPDSYLLGKNIHQVRQRFGHELWREHPVDADIVVPVPDSGIPAALGFHKASRIPYTEGMIKSRYIHRTFIEPDQRRRDLGVRLKLKPLRENLEGKKVVLVDDSIVRGTTSRQMVQMMRNAGAKEVHMRISSPPYKWPCFYGVDTPDRSKLIAANRNVEQIRKEVGADTLGYLSWRGFFKAVGLKNEALCLACFDGKYCIPGTDALVAEKLGKAELEKTV